MKDIVGSPGTRGSLVLRVSQFVCATTSIVFLASVHRFTGYTFFCILAIQMSLLSLWSMVLVCLDAMALKKNWDLHHARLVLIYFLVDWALAIGSLAAVSSAAGVAILFKIDTDYCHGPLLLDCSRFQVSVILGSMAWTFISASAVSTFFLLVAVNE